PTALASVRRESRGAGRTLRRRPQAEAEAGGCRVHQHDCRKGDSRHEPEGGSVVVDRLADAFRGSPSERSDEAVERAGQGHRQPDRGERSEARSKSELRTVRMVEAACCLAAIGAKTDEAIPPAPPAPGA